MVSSEMATTIMKPPKGRFRKQTGIAWLQYSIRDNKIYYIPGTNLPLPLTLIEQLSLILSVVT